MKRTDYPNVTEVRHQARADWEQQFKRRLTIQERIKESVPWWLVIVAGVFFLLSVPHTMAVFNKITPFWGKFAPFGIEFGLLYASFRRRVGQRTMQLTILETLLFLTAILVNGAGSLEAVVKSTRDVQGLSLAELIAQIGDLPATSQIALVLVPAAAFIIPIGTVVAGEGLAALALEFRETGNLMLATWDDQKQDIEFMALRDAAIDAGATPKQAIRWASQIVQLDTTGQHPSASVSDTSGQSSDRKRTATDMGASEAVFSYLREEGDPDVGVRKLAEIVRDHTGVQVSKTTASDVLNRYRSSQNGHGGSSDDE
jgi:hypothetical protein